MIVALAGGVGGAKLAQGLYLALPPETLTVVGNTADDMIHLGLRSSPDLDTGLYTLAGLANAATGWGLAGDSTRTFDLLKRYGAEDWFLLGDLDLATHLRRTTMLAGGATLTAVTASLTRALDVRATILRWPARRRRLRAVSRSCAMMRGPAPWWSRLLSSPSTTSLTKCSPFSTPQCPRLWPSRAGASAAAGGRLVRP